MEARRLFGVNLVEHSTIGKVRLLGLGPAAKGLVDRDELDLRKLGGELRLSISGNVGGKVKMCAMATICYPSLAKKMR